MDEQEFGVRVGELATRVGYPLPSVSWVPKKGRWLEIDHRGVAAPVMRVRPNALQWCASLRDLLIGQALLVQKLGGRRHMRILTGVAWVVAAVAGATGARWFGVLGIAAALVAYYLLWTVVSAVYWRWMMRRVDARLLEILGPDALRDGLEHIRFPLTVRNLLDWVRSGAGALASERLRWLDVSGTN